MQRWCLIGFLTAAAASVASAEGSPKLQAPVKITLCELVASPERFQDKIVEVRAVIQTGLQTSLLRDDTCSAFIWLAGMDETPDNAATAVRKTREFQKMLGYLNKRYKPKDGSECVRCSLYKT